MVITWMLDVALAVLDWLLGLFAFLPALSLPASFSVVAPVPLMGASVAGLNTWVSAAVLVALGLVAGKVLQYLYNLIPFKAT